MGQLTLKEATELDAFTLIPEGTKVHARIVKVEEKDHKYFKEEDGTPQKRCYFTFEIEDDEVEGISMLFEKQDGTTGRRRLWDDTSLNFSTHSNCTLYQYALAALAVNELEPGFTFDPVNLEGNPVDIIVGIEEWESKKNFNEDGTPKMDSKNIVVQVLRSSATSSRSAFQREYSEEPFRVDAGEWWPDAGLGSWPARLLS